jgi:hypothetical protein
LDPGCAIAHEPSQTVWAKEIAKALEIVVAELIDDYEQNQLRTFVAQTGLGRSLGTSLARTDWAGKKDQDETENQRYCERFMS